MNCSSKYILKDCSCLTDPLDRYGTVCGYIDKEYGVLYPCDPGCCLNMCSNKDFKVPDVGALQTGGADLPAGFGKNLATSDLPTPTSSIEAPVSSVGSRLLPGQQPFVPEPSYKVWQILLVAFIPVLIVIFMSFFLT